MPLASTNQRLDAIEDDLLADEGGGLLSDELELIEFIHRQRGNETAEARAGQIAGAIVDLIGGDSHYKSAIELALRERYPQIAPCQPAGS